MEVICFRNGRNKIEVRFLYNMERMLVLQSPLCHRDVFLCPFSKKHFMLRHLATNFNQVALQEFGPNQIFFLNIRSLFQTAVFMANI